MPAQNASSSDRQLITDLRHKPQTLSDEESTYERHTLTYTYRNGSNELRTYHSFEHILRVPKESRRNLQIDICVGVPDELHTFGPGSDASLSETARPWLKVYMRRGYTELCVPMTEWTRTEEDGSARIKDPDRTITLSHAERYPLDTSRIAFFTKRGSVSSLTAAIDRWPGTFEARVARLWPAPTSTREDPMAAQRRPLSAGFDVPHVRGAEAAVYAKTRELLDQIEGDLGTTYGLTGSYEFQRLDIGFSNKTKRKVAREDTEAQPGMPDKDYREVKFLDPGRGSGYQPLTYKWVFKYEPRTNPVEEHADVAELSAGVGGESSPSTR